MSVSEPAEAKTEEMIVLEQPEVTPSLPAANQAMKGTVNQKHSTISFGFVIVSCAFYAVVQF